MKHLDRSFTLVFRLAGAALLLFILVPLASTLAASSPAMLVQTLFDPEVYASLVLTFWASALATGIALLGGLPLAYLLARRAFPAKRLVESLVDLPVVLPHTAAGIALLMVFGSRGLIGRPFAALGVFFTETLAGVVVAMLFVSLPYLVNLSREAFHQVDPELEQAACADGASSWQVFWLISLPGAWRGVVAGMLMMWARGISEFGAVVILAYHPKIMPVLVYERFTGFGLAAALPVAVVLIVIVLAVFAALRFILIPHAEG